MASFVARILKRKKSILLNICQFSRFSETTLADFVGGAIPISLKLLIDRLICTITTTSFRRNLVGINASSAAQSFWMLRSSDSQIGKAFPLKKSTPSFVLCKWWKWPPFQNFFSCANVFLVSRILTASYLIFLFAVTLKRSKTTVGQMHSTTSPAPMHYRGSATLQPPRTFRSNSVAKQMKMFDHNHNIYGTNKRKSHHYLAFDDICEFQVLSYFSYLKVLRKLDTVTAWPRVYDA